MKEFDYTITEKIAVISEKDDGDFTLELNRIAYNGRPPVLDLRRWDRRSDRMQKGITLSDEEAESLKDALTGMGGA